VNVCIFRKRKERKRRKERKEKEDIRKINIKIVLDPSTLSQAEF
jgi:hypothetical protein